MKILVIGNQKRYEKFMPSEGIVTKCEKVYAARGSSNEELLALAADAQVILADAISPVDEKLIEKMPNLKLIHSEGVAFDKIAAKAAADKGIYVCNNKGANAGAVAEQTILLMLGLLRFVVEGQDAVLDGRQIQIKEAGMVNGITDLTDCTVGLIGFGDIAKATAMRLQAFGCKCYYYTRHRKSPQVEQQYQVEYRSLDELLPLCDIVSLHMAVNEETSHMADRGFLDKMKQGSYLINTGRGELVDQAALTEALENGHLAGAGLDTLDPEPVTVDNILVQYEKEHPYSILFSPHIGGITTGSFQRMHQHMWDNVQRLSEGQKPDCIVNGL